MVGAGHGAGADVTRPGYKAPDGVTPCLLLPVRACQSPHCSCLAREQRRLTMAESVRRGGKWWSGCQQWGTDPCVWPHCNCKAPTAVVELASDEWLPSLFYTYPHLRPDSRERMVMDCNPSDNDQWWEANWRTRVDYRCLTPDELKAACDEIVSDAAERETGRDYMLRMQDLQRDLMRAVEEAVNKAFRERWRK